MTRDILAEAIFWRENLARREDKVGLFAALTPLSDTTLVQAYHLWWSTYSAGIRTAPSNKPQQGVSGEDASRAGRLADVAVLSYLNDDWETPE